MLLILAFLAATQQRVAVLEFDVAKGTDIGDRTFFTDKVRGEVHAATPQLLMMTHENTLQILKASGKKLENCEGECEVETGRMLGADFVISGRIAKVGSRYFLTLRLHRTASGDLLNSSEAHGKSIDELVDSAEAAARELVKPLVPLPAAKQEVRPAPSGPPTPVQKAAPAEVQKATPAPVQATSASAGPPAAPPPQTAAPAAAPREECASPDDCYAQANSLAPHSPGGMATIAAIKLLHNDPAGWKRAKRLYGKACDGKVGLGCAALGKLRLAEQDRLSALDLFRRACQHDVDDWAKSCKATEAAGFNGGGESGDLEIYEMACDAGLASSCSWLGHAYSKTDPERSTAFYRRACKLGDREICQSSLVK